MHQKSPNSELFPYVGSARLRRTGRLAAFGLFAVTVGSVGPRAALADVEYHDTLEKALLPLVVVDNGGASNLDILLADQFTYDSNLYRLPANIVDLSFIGPSAAREDHINTASVGLDGQWTLGRQVITVDLRGDDNRFDRNGNLNYVSSNDAVTWNWALGDKFSGQMGADYLRTLGGFYNTDIYTRDVVEKGEFFGAGRYQLGPHISVYGGVMYADTSLSAPSAAGNDNRHKTVDLGIDYATGATSSFGLDYRYSDARYSHSSVLNGVTFNPDYRDDAVRVSFKDSLTEKTQIEAVGGYLKREYPSTAIGAFTGYIWRLSVDWHPTEKTEILFAGSRDLQADLSAQTDYFVSNAVSISPSWLPSEKVTVSLTVSRDQQDFIGTSQFVPDIGTRRDSVNSGQVSLLYSPFVFTSNRALTFNALFRLEHRTSNQPESSYDDKIGKAGATFKF